MKKWIALVLTLCLILSSITVLADDISAWARDAVEALESQGILLTNQQDGYQLPIHGEEFYSLLSVITKTYATVGTYRSEPALTRGMAAVILSGFISTIGFAVPDVDISYTDAGDCPDIESVRIVTALGLMQGVGSQRFAPNDPLTVEQAAVILQRLKSLPCGKEVAVSEDNLQILLSKIAARKRGDGTENEAIMADYIATVLKSYGYETTIQPFEFNYAAPHERETGTSQNVIAVKKAPTEHADILYITAHHDSISTTTGACDNASGVTALLEVARLTANLNTDTEIRFISFGAEESGRRGSGYYTDNLSQEEIARSIGDIQLDMLGHRDSTTLHLFTVDGNPTLLGNLLNSVNGTAYPYKQSPNSDHASFVKNGIPAVLLEQDASDLQNHNIADTIHTIDFSKLAEATKQVHNTIVEIADPATPSYLAEAKKINNYAEYIPVVKTTDRLYFTMEPSFNDNTIGKKGILVANEEFENTGIMQADYLYTLKWFDLDTPLSTTFEYFDNSLALIRIDMAQAFTQQQTIDAISAIYGEGKKLPDSNALLTWIDPIYKRNISLIPDGDSYTVEIGEYGGSLTEFNSYSIKDGVLESGADIRAKAVWELVTKLLPESGRKYITKVVLLTDGIGNMLASMGPADPDSNNAEFTLSIDVADSVLEDGSIPNYGKLVKTLIHEYGHVLSWNDTQLKAGPDVLWNGHQEGQYYDGAYMQLFYQQFWSDRESVYDTNYFKDADNFVSEYAETKMTEDFADSFCTFVIMETPEGNTMAEQKVKFFYQFDELVAVRDHIRNVLHYE